MAPGGVVAHSSSWTPAAFEPEESSSEERVLSSGTNQRHELMFQNFVMNEGSKKTRLRTFLTDPPAGNAAEDIRGGAEILEPEDSLVLCLVVVVSVVWDSWFAPLPRRSRRQFWLTSVAAASRATRI